MTSIYSSNVQNIKNIEKADEDTVQITIDREIPFFDYNLIFPIISSKYFNDENLDIEVNCYQSNHEGDLVDFIQTSGYFIPI